MCLQCATDAVTYGEVVRGFGLYKTTKHHRMWEGWGLIQSNDPTFQWKVTPEVDPQFNWSDERIDNATTEEHELFDAWWEKMCEFEKCITECDPWTGFRLVRACLKAGYNPKLHGYRIACWLFHRMGEMVRDNKPIPHDYVADDGTIPPSEGE